MKTERWEFQVSAHTVNREEPIRNWRRSEPFTLSVTVRDTDTHNTLCLWHVITTIQSDEIILDTSNITTVWLTTVRFIWSIGTIDHTVAPVVTMDTTSCVALKLAIWAGSCTQQSKFYCAIIKNKSSTVLPPDLTWWPQVYAGGKVCTESFGVTRCVRKEPHWHLIGGWVQVMGGAFVSGEDSWKHIVIVWDVPLTWGGPIKGDCG